MAPRAAAEGFKACVSAGCHSDAVPWEVAGVSQDGRVEWWCLNCAQRQKAQHTSLNAARLAWMSRKVRLLRLITKLCLVLL